ncbi:hypothetical protein ACFU1R_00860 [Priestia megaterium]|uniref:hypothetical protein n=1 Tax=Priestia megaterium TaxID=1404 RepID=UPI00366BF374
MASKTFFFRKDYSIKEMEERIFAEDFIKVFKGYAAYVSDGEDEEVEINKRNCYRGLIASCIGDEERLITEMKRCFNTYGRKGDRLNVKLFVLEDFNFTLLDSVKTRIDDLVNNTRNIKEIDSLSHGLNDNIFLQAIEVSSNKIDFKYKLEQVFINTDLPIPTEEIKTIQIECRLYINTGIVAMFNPYGTATHTKNVLSIIHLLFKGHSPRFYEVNLDEAQLIMINLRLNGQVSSPKFTSTKDELRIDIYGLNEGNQENPFVKFVGDSQLEIYELTMTAVIHNHNCTVKLNGDGKIQIETFVTPEVLDSIILDLDWVVFTNNYYNDYNEKLNIFIKQINRGSLEALRKRKIKRIVDEFENLITTHIQRSLIFKELKLVTTIIFNIGIQLIDSDNFKYISKEVFENGHEIVSHYTEISDALSKYMILNKGLNKSESDKKAIYILSHLHSLIVESNGDGVKIIDSYEEWLKCQTQITTSIQQAR